MYYYKGIFLMFIYSTLPVYGERDLFEKKCKRECNTEHGSLDCWKATTDGFTYGLSTTMIDYCQVLLQLHQRTHDNVSWYNVSHGILIQAIDKYELSRKVHQLTKDDIKQVAISLLDKCIHDTSSYSTQPSCPSCPKGQAKFIEECRTVSLILTGCSVLLIVIIIFLYAFQISQTNRSYQSIG